MGCDQEKLYTLANRVHVDDGIATQALKSVR